MTDPRLSVGTNHCRCSECGEYFTTPRNFDLHRSGTGTTRDCLDPASIVDKHGKARLRRNLKGIWASTDAVFIPKDKR